MASEKFNWVWARLEEGQIPVYTRHLPDEVVCQDLFVYLVTWSEDAPEEGHRMGRLSVGYMLGEEAARELTQDERGYLAGTLRVTADAIERGAFVFQEGE